MAVIRHADSWVELQHLGTSRPYRPTYEESAKLGPTHRQLLTAPLKPGRVTIDIGIPGSLRREDAAKLYELMYFGVGDALVLGSDYGLATAISAQAIYDSGRRAMVVGVEASARRLASARAHLAALDLDDYIELVEAEALDFCTMASSRGLPFGVVFVDHSTSYADVRSVCQRLTDMVAEGGFVQFHDFNDRRNIETTPSGYGVFSGVKDGLPVPPFEFHGVFGCSGLYRAEVRENAERHLGGIGVASVTSRD